MDTDRDEPEHIPYKPAIDLLADRWNATPAELAAWVMFGDAPDCGGLRAFQEMPSGGSAPKLEFDCRTTGDFDYLEPLMGAWFVRKEVEAFEPESRYIEYPKLVERWGACRHLVDVDAFIAANIHDGRLNELHPVTGRTELSDRDGKYCRPPRETALLDLDDVKAIELEDGILPAETTESTDERAARLLAWFEEERRRNPSGALKRTAERECIAYQTLQGILQRAREKRDRCDEHAR